MQEKILIVRISIIVISHVRKDRPVGNSDESTEMPDRGGGRGNKHPSCLSFREQWVGKSVLSECKRIPFRH